MTKESIKEIANFTSTIECDLYFKAKVNNYLSFIIKDLMSQRSSEEGKLLSCICNDQILMNFLNPYFKETLTVDLLEGTKSWFKSPSVKLSLSRRSLLMLKNFKAGYFDCVAIRLFNKEITSDNFKKIVEVFKKITKHLIVIEDHRFDNKSTPSHLIKEYNKTIESYFTCTSNVKMYQWNFKWYENNLF